MDMKTNQVSALIDSTMTTEDEYTVEVSTSSVVIKSGSARGLFYGLQIIIQLYHMSKGSGEIPCLPIKDCPAFKYRGLMLDVSRHFVPKDFLLKQIDCLAYFKISRFHIHLTDAGGWRLEIKKYPLLTQKAAYRTESDWQIWWNEAHDRKYSDEGTIGAYGGYYTQEDMREVVKYAADRYITIIPEIEMPGHSEEVLYAYPEFSCSGQPYKNSDFCVGNEGTFEFLENILSEVFDIFPSQYIHIGCDEASMGAWYNCPKCQQRMKDNNFTEVDQLQSYLIKRIEKFINENGRTLIGWDEILKGGLAPNAVVMSWTGEGGGIEAAKAGHQVIMTLCQWVYLDYLSGSCRYTATRYRWLYSSYNRLQLLPNSK
ncbi:Glycosyl hydrolase family 20, catalytic domain containing protein [Trichomonas vaginalis G3]|uniref:beta-N-acetylhexosaminidase n=1 Tax=Trichomonas vaginalis (strain ATCC PRA-98 / G3) TaxID=412133 RepID=A2EGN9_TRIV3|nr:glycosyl hydrolase [Trichomonas vaginalis G3]EAY08127.1 Glycosyl hydrolase family 20, catalytic domain containing protein [Trichomonas vaginalis G3]KAI5548742.1 GH20 chitobiase-like domain-containing protein [Trichomonas vaginalis G3]|eukprot:XP_001320350.1 glycosyl hydrolase [Trichomonas vaginalis G3]